jgi:hypothetical protein
MSSGCQACSRGWRRACCRWAEGRGGGRLEVARTLGGTKGRIAPDQGGRRRSDGGVRAAHRRTGGERGAGWRVGGERGSNRRQRKGGEPREEGRRGRNSIMRLVCVGIRLARLFLSLFLVQQFCEVSRGRKFWRAGGGFVLRSTAWPTNLRTVRLIFLQIFYPNKMVRYRHEKKDKCSCWWIAHTRKISFLMLVIYFLLVNTFW